MRDALVRFFTSLQTYTLLLALAVAALLHWGIVVSTTTQAEILGLLAIALGAQGAAHHGVEAANVNAALTLTSMADGKFENGETPTAAFHRNLALIRNPSLLPKRKPEAGSARLNAIVSLAFAGLFSFFLFLELSAAFGGCAATKADGKTMSGAFATCAKADLGQLIASSATTLLGTVAAAIEDNVPTLEDDLGALAEKVGGDAVRCAIASVEQVVSATPRKAGFGSGSEPPPALIGVRRALAWSAARPGARR